MLSGSVVHIFNLLRSKYLLFLKLLKICDGISSLKRLIVIFKKNVGNSKRKKEL